MAIRHETTNDSFLFEFWLRFRVGALQPIHSQLHEHKTFTDDSHPVSGVGACFGVGGCGLRHVEEAKQEARARACAARGNSCTPSPAQ